MGYTPQGCKDITERLTLSAFNILFIFNFIILITVCFGVFLCGLNLCRTLCFLDLGNCFLSQVKEVFHLLSLQIFSQVLSPLSSPSGIFIMQILVFFLLFQRSLKLSSFIFILFFLSVFGSITTLSSSSFICSFVSFSLILVPPSVFFISVKTFPLLYSSILFGCSLSFLILC